MSEEMLTGSLVDVITPPVHVGEAKPSSNPKIPV
jgi:hypothetical protein